MNIIINSTANFVNMDFEFSFLFVSFPFFAVFMSFSPDECVKGEHKQSVFWGRTFCELNRRTFYHE